MSCRLSDQMTPLRLQTFVRGAAFVTLGSSGRFAAQSTCGGLATAQPLTFAPAEGEGADNPAAW
ncbi:MAG: hypothetical protein AAF718_17745 [Pseudomonadota bacterium]